MNEITNTPASAVGSEQKLHIYPAPVEQYGLDPYENEGDRWLYEESMGDTELLFMLAAKERLGQAHSLGNSDTGYQDKLRVINEHIAKRKELVEDVLDHKK